MAPAKKRTAKTTAPDIGLLREGVRQPEAGNSVDRSADALPVGAVIEHEGPDRWRVHVPGQPQYGHGTTHAEAVADYLSATTPQAT